MYLVDALRFRHLLDSNRIAGDQEQHELCSGMMPAGFYLVNRLTKDNNDRSSLPALSFSPGKLTLYQRSSVEVDVFICWKYMVHLRVCCGDFVARMHPLTSDFPLVPIAITKVRLQIFRPSNNQTKARGRKVILLSCHIFPVSFIQCPIPHLLMSEKYVQLVYCLSVFSCFTHSIHSTYMNETCRYS